MDSRLSHFLSFAVGVTFTIGAYESLRLVQNTRHALEVASQQMGAQQPAVADAQASDVRRELMMQKLQARLSEGPTRARARPQLRSATAEGAEGSPKATRSPEERAERKAAIKEKWEGMSEEQRDAVKAKRANRRDALKARAQALREGKEPPPLPPGDDGPEELVDTGEEEQAP